MSSRDNKRECKQDFWSFKGRWMRWQIYMRSLRQLTEDDILWWNEAEVGQGGVRGLMVEGWWGWERVGRESSALLSYYVAIVVPCHAFLASELDTWMMIIIGWCREKQVTVQPHSNITSKTYEMYVKKTWIIRYIYFTQLTSKKLSCTKIKLFT